MSIINSDGLNTNWQLNVLKGLDANKKELAQLSTILAQITSVIAPAVRTTHILRTTGTGSLLGGVKSVTIVNVGEANGLVKAISIKPNESVTYEAGALNNVLDAINFDATSTEFLITYVI
jgi:hypothetical protein